MDETVLCHGRDDTFYLNQLDRKLQGKENLMKQEKLEEAITFEKNCFGWPGEGRHEQFQHLE